MLYRLSVCLATTYIERYAMISKLTQTMRRKKPMSKKAKQSLTLCSFLQLFYWYYINWSNSKSTNLGIRKTYKKWLFFKGLPPVFLNMSYLLLKWWYRELFLFFSYFLLGFMNEATCRRNKIQAEFTCVCVCSEMKSNFKIILLNVGRSIKFMVSL